MMKQADRLREKLENGGFDTALITLYGADAVSRQKERYAQVIDRFEEAFGESEEELYFFSAPGRTEIGGNHTDHNHGRVIAAGVDRDVIGVVRRAPDRVRVQSCGYPLDSVELTDLTVREDEINRSAALIRGTLDGFCRHGFAIGGFDAYTVSDVLKGSGMSSSAAFEVLIGVILNTFYNGGGIEAPVIAQIARYAENAYFGKPCGLMDQMASAVGNIITVDFADPAHPVTERLDFDMEAQGYALCIVNVGGDHADLTDEYAAVRNEMAAVAGELGVEYLRDTTLDAVLRNVASLREKFGDRAVLRALHFFNDDQRVAEQVTALKSGDFGTFLHLVLESGHSSCEYLQNVSICGAVRDQQAMVALALARQVLGDRGAWRIHGGGFGGTTQNFVPLDKLDAFRAVMERAFGPDSCQQMRIRPVGGICLSAAENT